MAAGECYRFDMAEVLGVCVRCGLGIPGRERNRTLFEHNGWGSQSGAGTLKFRRPTGRVLCQSCSVLSHPTAPGAFEDIPLFKEA